MSKYAVIFLYLLLHVLNNIFFQFIVKRIRSTVDEREQKQLLMDLEVIMKSNDCNYIVQFYGALFKEVIYSTLLIFIELRLGIC